MRLRKGIYQVTHEPLGKDRLRKIVKGMAAKEREIVERQKRSVAAQMRGRGARFGDAAANELLSKLGMFLIAEEKNLALNLRRNSVMTKLIEDS